MAEITQIITQFPPAPDSATDTPQEFNTKANAFVNHQSDSYVGEVNTWATQANAVRDDVNNIVASIPDGLIDDTTPSLVNTYSSQKIEDELTTKTPTNDPRLATAWGGQRQGIIYTGVNGVFSKTATGIYKFTFDTPMDNNKYNAQIFVDGAGVTSATLNATITSSSTTLFEISIKRTSDFVASDGGNIHIVVFGGKN